jgi:hypothetical protein
MTAVLGVAVGDVLWSLTFLGRYALAVLALSAIPAAQRITAALHPGDPRVYAWPVEVLVAALRLGTLAVVFCLGWREDASVRREGTGTIGEVLHALGAYGRHDWKRLLVGALIAAIVFGALNALAGPVIEAFVRHSTDDTRIAAAWTFGVRNLLIIPLWYAIAYGLMRPAFLHT